MKPNEASAIVYVMLRFDNHLGGQAGIPEASQSPVVSDILLRLKKSHEAGWEYEFVRRKVLERHRTTLCLSRFYVDLSNARRKNLSG